VNKLRQKYSHTTYLTLADISRCVIFALITKTNALYCVYTFAVGEYDKTQTIASWR